VEIGVKETVRLSNKAARLRINNQCCNNRHRCEDIRKIFRQKTANQNRTARHERSRTQQQDNIQQPPAATYTTTAVDNHGTQGQAQATTGAPEYEPTTTPTTPQGQGQAQHHQRAPEVTTANTNRTPSSPTTHIAEKSTTTPQHPELQQRLLMLAKEEMHKVNELVFESNKHIKRSDKQTIQKKMIRTYGDVKLDNDELEYLMLGPDFAVVKQINRLDLEQEYLRGMTIIR
jgi:hypothetical protein